MRIPVAKTLWTDCLFELIEKAKKEGKEFVDFGEVDNLVLKKSKLSLEQKRKMISISFRGQSFIINRPKRSISISENGDIFNIAIDGVNEITYIY